jgi:hypothetical protein
MSHLDLIVSYALYIYKNPGYGIHVSGFVSGGASGPPKIWVAQRSAAKPTYPNMFDCIVGGGQPYGLR